MIPHAIRFNPSGWLFVAVCFVALCLVYATRSSLGLMMPFWEDDPGWSRGLASSGGALVLLLMAICSPLAGYLLDRIGPRPVCAGGLLLVGVGVLLTARSVAEWQLIAYYGVFVGIGSGAVAMPLVTAVVARHFATYQGIAAGVGFSGATGGQLIALPTLGLLVTANGWRGTYVILGLTVLGFALLAWLLLRRCAVAGSGTAAPEPEPLRERLRFLITNRTFLLLLGGFVICGFTTAGVIEVHLLPYAEVCGYTAVTSTTAYGVHGLFNMIGVILFGLLADHLHRPRLLAAIYFVRAGLFVVLMFIAGNPPLLFIFAAAFGLLNFATLPVIASIVTTHIGVRIVGLTMGIIFGGHWLGAAIGAYAGGVLYDLLARYDWVWIVALMLAALAGVLSLGVRESRAAPTAPAPAPA